MALETVATLADPKTGTGAPDAGKPADVNPNSGADNGASEIPEGLHTLPFGKQRRDAIEAHKQALNGGPGEAVDGSDILKSLSPEAYKKYMLTGNLPPSVDKKEREERVEANTKILRELTPDERKSWRATGELPERFKTETKSADAAPALEVKAAEVPEELSHLVGVDSPLAEFTVLNSSKEKGDLEKRAAATQKEFPQRFDADTKKYTKAERDHVTDSWNKIASPQIVQMLGPEVAKNFMAALNGAVKPLLHAPYSFWKELSTNESFRRELLTAGFGQGGNFQKVLGVVARFDAKHAPVKAKIVSSAPAPAASISGKATAPVDEVGAALHAQDFRRFMRAENETQFRKGKR